MPAVLDAAKRLKREKVVLVNAELVSSKLLRGGDGSVANVTHFPFLQSKGELYKGKMNADEIATFCGPAATAPATTAATTATAAPADEKKEEDDAVSARHAAAPSANVHGPATVDAALLTYFQ